jgi:mono/diheme cytochrome c family protein
MSNPDPDRFNPPLPSLAVDLAFFDSRNGMGIGDLVTDTRTRAESLPRRKADIQKIDLNRIGDRYLFSTSPAGGLIQSYGATTSAMTDISNPRIRQEVFQRPGSDLGNPDNTVMGGIYVDREDYSFNTNPVALYRYFLEPLGVSVDKWSMGVRGRSRTYTFADVFSIYGNTFDPMLGASLLSNPVPGLSDPNDCRQLVPAVNATLSSLPAADATPTFTDVQRIFNKSCIECHGDLGYPPYGRRSLDFSEDEAPPTTVPPPVSPRLARSYANAAAYTTTDPATSDLYQRITQGGENCPGGIMPCGGPPLSKADTETIRRWIVGKPGGYTEGDPHIRTVDGVNYDFQSAGEFVLLRDENLEIQARQIPVATTAPLAPNGHTGLSSCVSLNGAVAVRVGEHRITYQPNISGRPDPEGLQLRIDGKLTKMSAREILLESGGRIVRTPATGGIQIEAPGGPVVVITPDFWTDYQVWYMNINVRNVRATQGVMGVIARGNWLPALPDGSLMGARPADLHQRYLDLYRKFANAWRVKDATSLFDYAPGTSTRTFTLANWPEESPRSCAIPRQPGAAPPKPPLKPLAPEIAKQHCSAVVDKDRKSNCEQDVMVTGHAGFAKTYLQTEQIERNEPPPVPVLDAPIRNMADFAKTLTFNWNKSSKPDGSAITYRLCVWVSGDKPTFKNCDAPSNVAGFDDKTVSKVLSALEPGKDYLWKVIAEDGKGGSTESETRRFTIN